MRVRLAGEGNPIPTEALPDPNLNPDLPPQTFIFTSNGEFNKFDWENLGYTHFEAICIGACGGAGGGVTFPTPDGEGGTHFSRGGAGGGGGRHRVAGLLEDLPLISPIVVGVQGANGVDGNGEWKYLPVSPPTYPLTYYLNPAYVGPSNGQPGGFSTFNDDVGMASGGQGGKATPVYRSIDNHNGPPYDDVDGAMHLQIPGGDGGEGGCGGYVLAGGGAPGAWSEYTFHDAGVVGGNYYQDSIFHGAADGTWDGVIGQGGGGGRGGTYRSGGGSQPQVLYDDASSGGQGSFSYEDTSVFGPRQSRSTYVIPGRSPQPIVAGGGGGAKLNKTAIFGSLAISSSPHGVVQVRIFKVD